MNDNFQIDKILPGQWYRFSYNKKTKKSLHGLSINRLLDFVGNYAIFLNQKLIYIGQSTTVFKRLWAHCHTFEAFLPDETFIVFAVRKEKDKTLRGPGSERTIIESNLQKRLRPRGNFGFDLTLLEQRRFRFMEKIL